MNNSAGLDQAELVKWLSVIDECEDEVLETSALPALQGLLERAEKQAGRVLANEVAARLSDGSQGDADELGRDKLREFCAP